MRIIVGISGASGAPYALDLLRRLHEAGHETHVVASEYGEKVLAHECDLSLQDIRRYAHALYNNNDITAPIASGSFRADGMVIVPCSMRTLAAVACGLAGNLLCRAADVALKERRNLILAVRETPLSDIHLENMLKASRAGARVVPLCPGFYHHPKSINDLTAIMSGRIMDSLGIENTAFPRWNGMDTLSV